jgi:hypothetical protein
MTETLSRSDKVDREIGVNPLSDTIEIMVEMYVMINTMGSTQRKEGRVDATKPETRNQRYQLADGHDERRQGK